MKSDTVTISRQEIEWLRDCEDLQMCDGDTARKVAERWAKDESAIDVINEWQRLAKLPELKGRE